ncbi:hypothetical protein XENOCAPTIV_009999 [Xenoophorus captivus]|uniref:Uncharacterized protein n=1 Tax=Xenoophorus captivus TaxID=1517983 RepID=A0ABV0QQY7_9TELE
MRVMVCMLGPWLVMLKQKLVSSTLYFLDTNANSSRVRSIFEKIQISVDELQALALACSSCERKFKVLNMFRGT